MRLDPYTNQLFYQRKALPHGTASNEYDLPSFLYSFSQNVEGTPCAKLCVRAGDPETADGGAFCYGEVPSTAWHKAAPSVIVG